MFRPYNYLFIGCCDIKFALSIIEFIDLRGTFQFIRHADWIFCATKFQTAVIVSCRVRWRHWLKRRQIDYTCCIKSRIYFYWKSWNCDRILRLTLGLNYYLKFFINYVWRVAWTVDLHREIVSACKRIVRSLNFQSSVSRLS